MSMLDISSLCPICTEESGIGVMVSFPYCMAKAVLQMEGESEFPHEWSQILYISVLKHDFKSNMGEVLTFHNAW